MGMFWVLGSRLGRVKDSVGQDVPPTRDKMRHPHSSGTYGTCLLSRIKSDDGRRVVCF